MPCMGPGVNENEVNKAYEEVLAFLKTKYSLQSPVVHPIWKCGFMSARLDEQRAQANAQLKEAIRNMFLQQACEDF